MAENTFLNWIRNILGGRRIFQPKKIPKFLEAEKNPKLNLHPQKNGPIFGKQTKVSENLVGVVIPPGFNFHQEVGGFLTIFKVERKLGLEVKSSPQDDNGPNTARRPAGKNLRSVEGSGMNERSTWKA